MPPESPPPGFQGFRDTVPVTVYKRHLPHWRQENATYFITFRLNDSLPQSKLLELRELRTDWIENHPEPHSTEQLDELSQLMTRQQERWLDQGYGSCLLSNPSHQKVLQNTLLHFDQNAGHPGTVPRYELFAFVIMPNHVHLLVRPFDQEGHTLEAILQSWKRHSAREINKVRETNGSIWFEESYDRIVRDSDHLRRCLHYIGRNPRRAGKTVHECPRWVSSRWGEVGWGFASD